MRSLRGELARVISEAMIEADEASDGRDLADSIAAAVTTFLFDAETRQATRRAWDVPEGGETPAQRATRRQAALPPYYRPTRQGGLSPVRVSGSGPTVGGHL